MYILTLEFLAHKRDVKKRNSRDYPMKLKKKKKKRIICHLAKIQRARVKLAVITHKSGPQKSTTNDH